MATAPEDVTAEIGGYLAQHQRRGYSERLSVHVDYGDLEDWQAAVTALLAERERAIERAARRDFALDGFVEDWAWRVSAELREEYLTAARDWLYGAQFR